MLNKSNFTRSFLISSLFISANLCLAQNDERADSMRLSVGYISGERKTMAGAVDQVTEKRMNKGLVTNSLDALSGQAAGVSVNSGGNQEAMISAVRVRGTTSLTGGNDPLVIIDGVSSDLSTLSTIYPADIESFTILKDASETAQYGSRGASGVIEVTTKKGRDGKFTISYDITAGVEDIYKNIETLNASQYREYCEKMGVDYVDKGYDTDYRDAITRSGFVQNHHIAFGGGNEQANYRASLGLMDHQTVVKTNNYRTYIAKLDVSQHAFDDHLTVDLGLFGSLQKNNLIPFSQKLFYSAAAFNPTYPKGRNSSGSFDQISDASQINHPVSLLEMDDDEDNAHFNTHMKLSLNIGGGITVSAFGSYSYNTADMAHYYPTIVWSHGEAWRASDKSEELLGNISLAWTRDIGAHHIDFLALTEAQSQKMSGFHVTATNFTTDAYGYNNLSAGAVRLWEGTGSYYEAPTMESFLARINYVFKDRYTITVNAREDGSSKVGKNHRWGFFPSASGAWIFSDEPFMRDCFLLSHGKLRIGYGQSGNLGGIDSYNSLSMVQPNGVVSVEGTPTITLGLIRNANPDLKWEIKKTFNIGADIALWNERIVLTADYYNSKTTDMLYMYDVSVPPFAYDQLLANLGSMRSSGFELGLGVTPLKTKDKELNINVNMSFQRNKLLSLSGYYGDEYLSASDITPIGGLNGAGFHGGNNNIVYQIVGQPLGVFYLPHCTGLVSNDDGGYTYEIADLDGDGEINIEDGKDRYVAGQATPKMTLGSNISFRWREWDVSLQINGAFGHKIYNGTSLSYMNMLSLPSYNVMTAAPSSDIQDQTATDYWLEKGDYVNFDYVTIGWNVPIRANYIQSLRLSVSVNNIATITSYSGLTPMINSTVVGSTLGIDDKACYPVYRSFSCGLSIQF